MPVIESAIKPRSKEFKANAERMGALVADLRDKIETAAKGGSAASMARHVARGKLPAHERVRGLLDPGAPFLELSPLAAHDMYDDNIASAGIVTGIEIGRAHV